MSNQKETKKVNRLTINKETVSDLDVNNAGEVKGGATINQNQTERIRCEIQPKTVAGHDCATNPLMAGCPR